MGPGERDRTFSGLWLAVTITPIASPSNDLLLKAASNPTLNSTLSSTSALERGKGESERG